LTFIIDAKPQGIAEVLFDILIFSQEKYDISYIFVGYTIKYCITAPRFSAILAAPRDEN